MQGRLGDGYKVWEGGASPRVRWGYLGTQVPDVGMSRGRVLQGLGGGCKSPCYTEIFYSFKIIKCPLLIR